MTKIEAEAVAQECGEPKMVLLYDEEGVDGWEWEHPDGRVWCEIGVHENPPPPHPILGDHY